MKTNNLLKKGFFVAAITLFSAGAFAQLPSPSHPVDNTWYTLFSASGTRESVDTVTVGSRMTYKTTGDPAINALVTANKMAASEFTWVFSNSQAVYVPSANGTTTAPTPSTVVGHAGYFSGSLKEIHTIMPANPTNSLTLFVNEWSMLTSTTSGCEGKDTTYNIVVVNRPTLRWPGTAAQSICASTAINLLLTLTGYSQWEVTYKIDYYDDFVGTGVPTTPGTSTKMTVPANKTLNFAATNFVNAGTYKITIENLTDRISRKSLDQSLVVSQSGDFLNGAAYTVTVVPAPNTQKLQHVKNM